MSEFTKGKWYLDNDKENIYVIYENEEDGQKRRVYVAWAAGGIHDEEVEANARLIAAAPEMYEILKGLPFKLKANGADEREEIDEAIQEMESLLARIDGEEAQE